MNERNPTPAPPALIEARGLALGWGQTRLLEGLDFDVPAGRTLALIGGSGCGKSTLLRHLIGLEQPLAGEIHWHLPKLAGLAPEAPRAGVLFQSSALFGSLTLIENVALPILRWTAMDETQARTVAAAKLRLVGLDGFDHHLPAEISGGMKKRAGIARALALDPALLMLDEPSAGLDPITSAELDELLLSLKRDLGMTLVLVTHELASLMSLADDALMLDREARGAIAHGPPEQLARDSVDPRVRRFFDRKTRRGA